MNYRTSPASTGFRFVMAVTFALAVGAARVSAQDFALPKTLADMVAEAESAEVVDVVAAVSHRNVRGNLIVTDYRLRTVQPLLGSTPADFTLTQGGGSFGGETHEISDAAKLEVGRRYLVFVRPHPDGLFPPFVGGAQGVFSFVGQDMALSLGGGDTMRNRDGLLADIASLAASRGASAPREPKHGTTPPGTYPAKVYQPLALTPASAGPTSAPASREESAGPINTAASTQSTAAEQPPASTYQLQSPNAHWDHLIAPPAVIDAFPHDWVWHPFEENQLAYWNDYGGDVFRVYQTPTGNWAWNNDRFDLAGWPDDATMTAQFGVPWPADFSGWTFSRWFGDGIIIESDTALNPAFCWTLDDVYATDGTGACQSFRATMLHEVGHGWGLSHPWETQVVSWDSVMNYSPAPYRFPRLYADDAMAVRTAFGGPAVHDALLSLYTVSSSTGVGAQPVYTPTQTSTVYATHGTDIAAQMGNQFKIENLGTDDIVSPQADFYLSQNRGSFDGTVAYIASGHYTSIPAGFIYTYWLPSLPIPAGTPTGVYYFAGALPAGDNDNNNNNAWGTQNWNNEAVQVHVDNTATNLVPATYWQASEVGVLGPQGVWTFGFSASAGEAFDFSLCTADGGWATFDTTMDILIGGSVVATNDDYCDLQSSLNFVAPSGAYYTIRVGSYLSQYQGSFQLAYRRVVADPVYHDGFDG